MAIHVNALSKMGTNLAPVNNESEYNDEYFTISYRCRIINLMDESFYFSYPLPMGQLDIQQLLGHMWNWHKKWYSEKTCRRKIRRNLHRTVHGN